MITVGQHAAYAVVDPRYRRVFITGYMGTEVLDAHGGRLVGVSRLRTPFVGPVADARSGHVFVSAAIGLGVNLGLSMLDGRDGHVLRAHLMPFDAAVTALASDGAGRIIACGGTSMRVLDAASGATLRTVTLPQQCNGLAVDARTGRVFVAGTPDLGQGSGDWASGLRRYLPWLPRPAPPSGTVTMVSSR